MLTGPNPACLVSPDGVKVPCAESDRLTLGFMFDEMKMPNMDCREGGRSGRIVGDPACGWRLPPDLLRRPTVFQSSTFSAAPWIFPAVLSLFPHKLFREPFAQDSPVLMEANQSPSSCFPSTCSLNILRAVSLFSPKFWVRCERDKGGKAGCTWQSLS